MNTSMMLRTVARHLPDRPAITSDSGTIDYATFELGVSQIAGALRRRHGLAPGNRVAIVMDNAGEYLPALFGIWRAGLCAVPINSKLHAKEVCWIVANSEAKLVIASFKHGDALTSAGVGEVPIIVTGTSDWRALTRGEAIETIDTPPEADAWLFYTSGTTGRPKGAVLSHRNIVFACHAYYADIDFVDERDVYVNAAPLSHGAGVYALPHIARGSHQIVHAGFDPETVLRVFTNHRNVSMFAAPTMITRLVNHPLAGSLDHSGLKTLIYGGAPMYVADLKKAISIFGPRFFQLYGQGEAPMTITGLTKRLHADIEHPKYEERLASAGVARTGCAFRIVDDMGRDLPSGEVGEIVTRSDCVMTGYWNNPEANAKSLRDGWLWTGDLGAVDTDGFLTLKDRSKDMIISGGSNIYPREIEDVLLTHGSVLECAVVSKPHADWGEEVVAFVVTRPGTRDVNAQVLDRLCLDNIARFKRPKSYRFVDALPKNNYGKILKTDLRERLKAEDDQS